MYVGLCRVLAFVVSCWRGDVDKDVELVVLRHQVRTLERQLPRRVRYSPVDRALLAALSRLLPRERWRAFLVTPGTLLRWHREAGRRKWRAWRRQRSPGRPAMSGELVELIVLKGATISIRTLSWHSAPPPGIIGRGLCSRLPRALPCPGFVVSSRRGDADKDLELVVLRHQVRIPVRAGTWGRSARSSTEGAKPVQDDMRQRAMSPVFSAWLAVCTTWDTLSENEAPSAKIP